MLERVLNQAQHNWYITNVSNTLIFARKKTSNNVSTAMDRFYFHMMSDHFIIRGHWEHFVTRLAWTDRIQYEIYDDPGQVFKKHIISTEIAEIVQNKLEKVLRNAWKDAVKDMMVRAMHSTKISMPILKLYRFVKKQYTSSGKPRITWEKLQNLLACPYCHSKLAESGKGFLCDGCGRNYKRVHGIPVFI
jgi:hypothetical protein